MRIQFLASYLFKGIKQLVADRKGNTLHIPGLLHEREHTFWVVKKKENQTRCKRSAAPHLSHIWWRQMLLEVMTWPCPCQAKFCTRSWATPSPESAAMTHGDNTALSLNSCTVVIANPKLLAPYGRLQAPSAHRSTQSYHIYGQCPPKQVLSRGLRKKIKKIK